MFKVIFSTLGACLLAGCASSPKIPLATFPKSDLQNPEKTDDGTAIAFQFVAPGCGQGGFSITPRLQDDKYGETTRFQYIRSILGLNFKPNAVDDKYIDAADKKRLHTKLMPAGIYVATRPSCETSNLRYSTQRDKLLSYFEFEVEAGKTNYIGEIKINQSGRLLIMSARDNSDTVKSEYEKRYSDKNVGPLKLSVARPSLDVIATARN